MGLGVIAHFTSSSCTCRDIVTFINASFLFPLHHKMILPCHELIDANSNMCVFTRSCVMCNIMGVYDKGKLKLHLFWNKWFARCAAPVV